MVKKDKAPVFVRVANVLTLTLLRAGFPLVGPGLVIGNYPMYLLTVRGRKSGQPRTVALAIIERNGKRYVGSPYGIVDWVRNLRSAGEALLTRGRRVEEVRTIELPPREAGLVLKRSLEGGIPSFLAKYFEVTAESSPEEFERAGQLHPVFLFEKK